MGASLYKPSTVSSLALFTTVAEEDLSNLNLSVLAVMSQVLFVELSDYSLSYCEAGRNTVTVFYSCPGLEELTLAKLYEVPGELIGELEISLVTLARIVTAVSIGTLEQPWVWSTLLGYFRLWLRLLAGVHKSLFLPLS